MLSYEQLTEFLWTFSGFFQRDARHEIWVGSVHGPELLVVDEYALLYAYGPRESYNIILKEGGFEEGIFEIPAPHRHHYHVEFDADEELVLRYFEWRKSPLRPGDEQ